VLERVDGGRLLARLTPAALRLTEPELADELETLDSMSISCFRVTNNLLALVLAVRSLLALVLQ
jgi:hypothetical protein